MGYDFDTTFMDGGVKYQTGISKVIPGNMKVTMTRVLCILKGGNKKRI